MLYTIAVVLVILWLLGLATSCTMGGLIHVLVPLIHPHRQLQGLGPQSERHSFEFDGHCALTHIRRSLGPFRIFSSYRKLRSLYDACDEAP
jgi:hypothetical protein